jgi:hypothetical protein
MFHALFVELIVDYFHDKGTSAFLVRKSNKQAVVLSADFPLTFVKNFFAAISYRVRRGGGEKRKLLIVFLQRSTLRFHSFSFSQPLSA